MKLILYTVPNYYNFQSAILPKVLKLQILSSTVDTNQHRKAMKPMIKSSDKKQILSFSIFIILLAQINLDIFASNFRVSMGILLLPILIFLYQRIPVIPITLLAGAGVYLSRVLIHSLQYGFAPHALIDFFPELIFYYIYGTLFHLYFRKHDFKLPHKGCYILLFLMDYLANLTELICRLHLDAFRVSLQANILLVALARTVILWAVVTGLSQYKESPPCSP